MFDLFNPIPERINESKYDFATKIRGLEYIPNFISSDEERQLLLHINSSEWLMDLKRRVQHYGWKYDYRSRRIDYGMYLGGLPEWALMIAKRLYERSITSELSDQVIVNEYNPGQGIANHIDCEPCFGNSIVSLSLESTCIMNLINISTKEKVELILEPRSILVIKDESRYQWSHGIPARLADTINNQYTKRKRRLSMTFRKVIIK